MIRYFLAKGDRAGSATITEGLEHVTCSNPPPRVQIATLYMKTWCPACKREGYIAPTGPRQPGTGPNGKQWALSGDINICGCNPPPVFYAERGMKMTFTSQEVAAPMGPDASSGFVAMAPTVPVADEAQPIRWCLAWDSVTGKPLANRDFVAEIGGVRQFGKTDGEGYAMIETHGEHPFNIHVVFSSPKRVLKTRQGN